MFWCVYVQILDSAWSDLQKANEVQEKVVAGGHAPCDIILLKHPTIVLRLVIMSYLRFRTHTFHFSTTNVFCDKAPDGGGWSSRDFLPPSL